MKKSATFCTQMVDYRRSGHICDWIYEKGLVHVFDLCNFNGELSLTLFVTKQLYMVKLLLCYSSNRKVLPQILAV